MAGPVSYLWSYLYSRNEESRLRTCYFSLTVGCYGYLHSLSNLAITTSSAFQRLNVDEFSFPDAFIVFSELGETPEKARRENWQRKMTLNCWFPRACIYLPGAGALACQESALPAELHPTPSLLCVRGKNPFQKLNSKIPLLSFDHSPSSRHPPTLMDFAI